MSHEERKLLEETHALAKDTHRVVRQMRREQWFSFFFRILIWALVVIAPLYIFAAYINPIIKQMSPPGSTVKPTGWFGLPTSADIQKLLDQYKTK